MTEEDWLAGNTPADLLLWLGAKAKRRRSIRKYGLFSVACGLRVQSFMSNEITLRGLHLAERMAEGLADEREGDEYLAELGATPAPNVPGPGSMAWNIPFYAIWVMLPHRAGQSSAKLAVRVCSACTGVYYSTGDVTRAVEEKAAQAVLFRDVIGNPYRSIRLDPRWRSGDAVALARGIYDERAFDRMPLLADALMDAGCDHEDILSHCRGEGPHVRGCWVVDLILSNDR